MNDIYSVAAQIAVLYPCDTIRYVAGKIADIRAQSVGGLELEMQWSPGHRKNPIVRQFCEFAAESSLASREVASILLSACATRELVGKDGMLEILWTGPQTAAVPVRQTEPSLCELIDSANKGSSSECENAISYPLFMTGCKEMKTGCKHANDRPFGPLGGPGAVFTCSHPCTSPVWRVSRDRAA